MINSGGSPDAWWLAACIPNAQSASSYLPIDILGPILKYSRTLTQGTRCLCGYGSGQAEQIDYFVKRRRLAKEIALPLCTALLR